MIKIAIVDDEEQTREQILQTLKENIQEQHEVEIKLYVSGESSSRKFRRVTQRIFYLQTFRCNSWMEWNWENWSEGFALTCTLSSSHLMKNMRQKVIGLKHISIF